ncbi:MAG: Gfo/Idh/MocA family oxidoreductase [Solirubrobacteraceae bacterium]
MRVALIGLGYWGPNYARVLSEVSDAELVAACDSSPQALEFISARYPGTHAARTPDEIFENDEIDAVIIATPTSTHHGLALAALEAGKHVLCEKPLATTVAECDELILASDRARRILAVGHTFIFNPAVRQLRDLIVNGEIGRVLYCHSARTGLGPIRQDVNVLWDLAPHDLSILFYLLDQELRSVTATGQAFLREGTEDVVFLTLRFANDVLANVHASWLDPYKVRRTTVVGDNRMVVFDDVAVDEKLRIYDRGASYESVSESARGTEYGEFKALIRDGGIQIPSVPSREPLKEQVMHFVDCCRTGQRPESGGREARLVVAALEAATASLQSGGVPVELARVRTAAA